MDKKMKVYGLFRGEKAMDSRLFHNKEDAIKQAEFANAQFKEYNQFISKNYPDREKIKPVEVKEVNFSHKKNLEI